MGAKETKPTSVLNSKEAIVNMLRFTAMSMNTWDSTGKFVSSNREIIFLVSSAATDPKMSILTTKSKTKIAKQKVLDERNHSSGQRLRKRTTDQVPTLPATSVTPFESSLNLTVMLTMKSTTFNPLLVLLIQ